MKAMDKKLWREFNGMRMQALAIAMVIGSGVAIFIMSLSALDSLYETRERYYRNHHFSHIFASLKRAPVALIPHIQAVPGVDKVETRVVSYVTLDIKGFDEPVSAHLISLPNQGAGLLNQLYIRQGRLAEPGRDNEIVVNEKFAQAHGLKPGDQLAATINGRRKVLTIVGLALSPEYIYQIAPGALFPDYKRYGVLWMSRKPLASAYDMDGGFNNVTVTLRKESNQQDVIDQLDNILEPYGGIGSIAREDQLSHRFLAAELEQLKTMATVFPVIFFGVAAFLLNVVISRLINLQREQIAVLKAFGYSSIEIALHYSKLVLMIVSVGVVGGIGAGIWMGMGLSNLYTEFFSFPFMIFVLKPQVIIAATVMSLGVALLGTLYSVHRAVKLPPAQGMRPEQPVLYHRMLVERLGLQHWISQPTRMIMRHIERRPIKSLLTVIGISLAGAIIMMSGFQKGAIDYMIDVQYGISQKEDMIAIYTEPTSERGLYSLRSIPGVEYVEGFRIVPVTLRFEHRSYRTTINGIPPQSKLMRLLDTELNIIEVPPQGLILTEYLAKQLKINPGDMVEIEILEGKRSVIQIPLISTAKQYLGSNAYMQLSALNRVLKEGNATSGARFKVDKRAQQQVYAALKEIPKIAGVVEQRSSIRMFYDTMAKNILFFTGIATLLGAVIAFGVVYNSMRIALSERSRELASLRILGFRHSEITYILLGEFALLTLLSIPLGWLFGYGLCAYMALQIDTDLYRVPLILNPDVYAFSALVVIMSTIISSFMIWRNLARLDMVAVLKTKE